jgi:hypothetical protein
VILPEKEKWIGNSCVFFLSPRESFESSLFERPEESLSPPHRPRSTSPARFPGEGHRLDQTHTTALPEEEEVLNEDDLMKEAEALLKGQKKTGTL